MKFLKVNLAKFVTVFLIFFGFNSSYAISISGIVSDSTTKSSLPEVIVTNSGRTFTVFTDALGHYRISGLPSGKITLDFFLLGYVPEKISLDLIEGENRILNIDLPRKNISLSEVTVSQQLNIGQTMSTLNCIDKSLRPTNSAQDMLRLVPGLFIAQHAGGGKAEQIFLRGFDADHGTDFAVFIDGMPVNMVSHAHGQGYADFHFVIPETVDALKVSKGPYAAKYGDFATSGAGEFFTKNAIEKNEVKLEYGMFDTYRVLGMFNLLGKKHFLTKRPENAYVASEYNFSDSYFENPQHFHRFNLFTKYTGQLTDHTSLSFTASTFSSQWDASGQVPERAIEEGLITRFGSIDNSEGGKTSRTNANLILTTATEKNSTFRNQFFYSYYQFNLFSDFTFFLNDSLHGDEINQREKGRNIFGYNGTFEKYNTLFGKNLKTVAGTGTRIDIGETALSHTEKQQLLNVISDGMLAEENIFVYLDETMNLSEKFSVNAALRSDNFIFNYKNRIAEGFSGKKNVSHVSPKLSLYYSANPSLQLYLRSGFGFHSNDARSVVSGQSGNSLPRAFGYETGSTFKTGKNILFNIALWGLELENELIYVGDDGNVENSGATRRLGIDLAARWEITSFVFADVDLNYNHGRYISLPKGENFIPLAPSLTSTGGITLKKEKGFSASLRYRYIDSRPANENNTVIAKGYFLLDAVATYHFKNLEFGITAQNLLNAEWNEAQFDTESRLKNETVPVDELHFTPGTPFCLKGSLTILF
jgi:hypothetical protein